MHRRQCDRIIADLRGDGDNYGEASICIPADPDTDRLPSLLELICVSWPLYVVRQMALEFFRTPIMRRICDLLRRGKNTNISQQPLVYR